MHKFFKAIAKVFFFTILFCSSVYAENITGSGNEVAEIEEIAGFEKKGEVIGLMMYLGNPPELKEHLYTENRSRCLEMKEIAEETSFAYYECARVNAVIKGSKIVSIIEEIEVIE